MPRTQSILFASSLMAACASQGAVRTAPVSWPAGKYYVEGTVSYESGIGERGEVYSADLYVDPDGSLRLDNHVGGVCQEPTSDELRRDERLRRRTFSCGTVAYVLRPGADTVTGEVQAIVEEDYDTIQCVSTLSNGQCARTVRVQRTRNVRKEAPLRVRRVD